MLHICLECSKNNFVTNAQTQAAHRLQHLELVSEPKICLEPACSNPQYRTNILHKGS